MNRRKFLSNAAMIAAGAVMTPEGLWMPGQKLISIPKPAQDDRYWTTLDCNGLSLSDVYDRVQDMFRAGIRVSDLAIWNQPISDDDRDARRFVMEFDDGAAVWLSNHGREFS